MKLTGIQVSNWRNFKKIDIPIGDRVFLLGQNASGKSNFLDIFRFMRDVCIVGFKQAVESRGGIKKIRCLHATKNTLVDLKFQFENSGNIWTYRLAFNNDPARIVHEEVKKNNELPLLLKRPDSDDNKDRNRLLEPAIQTNFMNQNFREIYDYFKTVSYRHILPQIIRKPVNFPVPENIIDEHGWMLIHDMASMSKGSLKARLSWIEKALQGVVNINKFDLSEPDESGRRHLTARFEHWRKNNAEQDEHEFSDGTLRLIGLLWSLVEGNGLLLLEEPEIHLHSHIVRQIPALIHKLQIKAHRQVIVSSHSEQLLYHSGQIGLEEIYLITPSEKGGSEIKSAASFEDVRPLVENGLYYVDFLMDKTKPTAPDAIVQNLPF